MTDLERRIRDALGDQAGSAPPPHETEPTLRRTRRRQLVTVAGGALGALAVVGASIVGVTALMDTGRSRDELPATGPAITTTINGISITHPEHWFVVDPDEVGLNSTPDSETPTLPRLVLALSPAEIDERFACPGLVEGDAPAFLMTIQEQPLALAGEAATPWPVQPETLEQSMQLYCYPNWRLLGAEWTVAGRTFQARLGLAPGVSDEDRRVLLDAFAGMSFEPAAEEATSVALATGTTAGEDWTIIAERQADGLTLSLQGESFGIGGSFTPVPGELRTLHYVFGSGPDSSLVVFGAVPVGAVHVNVLTDPDAESVVEVLDVPDNISGELDAFVITLGAVSVEPVTIRAFDASEQLVASAEVRLQESGDGGAAVGTPVPSLPDEVLPEHGGTYWGLYVATAPTANDPDIQHWADGLTKIGYTPSVGDLACDDGAARALGLTPEWSRVAVYFASRGDALEAMRTITTSLDIGDTVGIARVITYCLD